MLEEEGEETGDAALRASALGAGGEVSTSGGQEQSNRKEKSQRPVSWQRLVDGLIEDSEPATWVQTHWLGHPGKVPEFPHL
jgi:hypothetical protein